MPYAALAPLHWYGPACAAMVVTDALGELIEAHPRRDIKPSISVIGTGSAVIFRPYRGYAAALDVSGNSYEQITPHQYKKISLTVNVGAVPSAFDITQSVLNAVASQYNYPGTIGNKINSSASAGDPWGTPLPGTYPPGSAGALLGGMDPQEMANAILTDPRFLTVAKFLGLK